MVKELAQTPGAPRASNVTWRGFGCRDTARRTEPTTANCRHVLSPGLAWGARFIHVALRKASLENLAELHLADTALESAARVPLETFAALRAMELRHACHLAPQSSDRARLPLRPIIGQKCPALVIAPAAADLQVPRRETLHLKS